MLKRKDPGMRVVESRRVVQMENHSMLPTFVVSVNSAWKRAVPRCRRGWTFQRTGYRSWRIPGPNEELKEVDRFVRKNLQGEDSDRFGVLAELVCEIAFENFLGFGEAPSQA